MYSHSFTLTLMSSEELLLLGWELAEMSDETNDRHKLMSISLLMERIHDEQVARMARLGLLDCTVEGMGPV